MCLRSFIFQQNMPSMLNANFLSTENENSSSCTDAHASKVAEVRTKMGHVSFYGDTVESNGNYTDKCYGTFEGQTA